MIKTIKNQPVASTHMDSHGEQFTLEDLEAIVLSIPAKVPLNVDHDLSLPPCGEMSNFKVVEDPNNSGHHMVICDVQYDDEKSLPNFGGFSWSAIQDSYRNSENPQFKIYLPLPHYRNQQLIDSILDIDQDLLVGKWIKKSSTPVTIALIVFVLKPVWDTVYKEVFEEKVKQFLKSLQNIWPTNTPIDMSFELPIEYYSPRPTAILSPPRNSGVIAMLTASSGIESALDYCAIDYTYSAKKISRIRLSYDTSLFNYVVRTVEYSDGEYSHIN